MAIINALEYLFQQYSTETLQVDETVTQNGEGKYKLTMLGWQIVFSSVLQWGSVCG